MSTTSPNDLPVIAADTASFFEKEGLLTPPQDNKRKLSTSTLLSSSRSSSSKTSASSVFTAASIHETTNEVVIPETLESKETLAFIGFTEDVAAEIYRRYITKPADQDEDLLDFAVGHVELHPVDDAFTNSDDWHWCLRALGVNAQLSNAIMMPEYEGICFTGSCKFWLLESINSNYYALANLDKQLQALQARIQTQRETSRLLAGPEMPAGTPSSLLSATSDPTSLGQDATEDNQDTSKTKERAAIAEPLPASLPGHRMLWLTCDKHHTDPFYDPVLKKISICGVLRRPGDFSGRDTLGYFTPQREVADWYVCWRKHREPLAEIVILQIAVPDAVVDGLAVHRLWGEDRTSPAAEWKSLVWHSRRVSRLPKELGWLDEKDVLIGHVASAKECKVLRVREPAGIRDTDVLTVLNGERRVQAIQWAFRSIKAEENFEEASAGKVRVHSMGVLKVPMRSEERLLY